MFLKYAKYLNSIFVHGGKKEVFLLLVLNLLGGICTPLILTATGDFLDGLTDVFVLNEDFSLSILASLLWLLVLSVISSTFSNLCDYLNGCLSDYIEKEVKESLMLKMENIPAAKFDESEVYNDIQFCNEHAPQSIVSIVTTLGSFFKTIAILFGVVGIVLQLSPFLVLLCIAISVPNFFISRYLNKRWFSLQKSQMELRRYAQILMQLCIKNETIAELKLFGMIKRMRLMARKTWNTVYGNNNRERKAQSSISVLRSLLSMLLLLSVKGIAIYLSILKKTSLGSANMYISAIDSLQAGIEAAMIQASSLYAQKLYLDAYIGILEVKEEDDGNDQDLNSPIRDIKFEHVFFTYPGTTTEILHDVSFELKAGGAYIIIGTNGAGKSTMFKLMMKIYHPTRGRIFVNGIDLECLSGESVRKQISVVFQNYVRLPLTIADNICMGDFFEPNRLNQAIDISRAREFIDLLPKKEKTKLQKEWFEGQELSIGQWQKIAIARSQYKRASLYLMDEAYSSVDVPSRYCIEEKVREKSRKSITVQITHQYSSLGTNDVVLFVQNGRLVDCGNKEELTERCESFREMMFSSKKGKHEN